MWYYGNVEKYYYRSNMVLLNKNTGNVISGVPFAALALGYATNMLKITWVLLYLSEPVMSVQVQFAGT